MSALIGGVVGATVAGLLAIANAVFQANRSHDRWLRETRLAAYTRFLAAAHTAAGARVVEDRVLEIAQGEDPQAISDEWLDRWLVGMDELETSYASVVLVGPERVAMLAFQLKIAAFDVGFGSKTDRSDFDTYRVIFPEVARTVVVERISRRSERRKDRRAVNANAASVLETIETTEVAEGQDGS